MEIVQDGSTLVIRRVPVNRDRAPLESLAAVNKKKPPASEKKIVASMPKGEGDVVDVYLFAYAGPVKRIRTFDEHRPTIGTDEHLEEQFHELGLKPDPLALLAAAEMAPDLFSRYRDGVGTHWRSPEGHWCMLAVGPTKGKSILFRKSTTRCHAYVERSHGKWETSWSFAGSMLPKTLTYGRPDTAKDFPMNSRIIELNGELQKAEEVLRVLSDEKIALVGACEHHFVPSAQEPTLLDLYFGDMAESMSEPLKEIDQILDAYLLRGLSSFQGHVFDTHCTKCGQKKRVPIGYQCPICASPTKLAWEDPRLRKQYFGPDFQEPNVNHALSSSCTACGFKAVTCESRGDDHRV